MVKKKKSLSPEKSNSSTLTTNSQELNNEMTISEQITEQSLDSTSNSMTNIKIPSFKNRQFVSNRSQSSSKKSRVWKNLKQILASDKTLISGVSYASLDCPQSTKPAKRYSDLSGLPAKYKDPTTQLLYHNSDEFAQIKMFSNDIINGYLELRKANN